MDTKRLSILIFSMIMYFTFPLYVKGGNLYIQNETMQENNHVRGDYIMVGSNVTTKKEEGPVVIENGAIILESANGVTITRDFEVKEGAEFEIKISN